MAAIADKARRALVVCIALCVGAQAQSDETPATESHATGSQGPAPIPNVTSQVVMFYYDDLAAAEAFYGEKVGLEKTQDFGWAKFFRVGPGAEVGIVKAGPGAYHATQPRNAVMLSVITTQVDAWYARLKADASIPILVDIHTSETAPIRNFMVADPGGYTVEFFQWLTRER
jgi:hypothetical protein